MNRILIRNYVFVMHCMWTGRAAAGTSQRAPSLVFRKLITNICVYIYIYIYFICLFIISSTIDCYRLLCIYIYIYIVFFFESSSPEEPFPPNAGSLQIRSMWTGTHIVLKQVNMYAPRFQR